MWQSRNEVLTARQERGRRECVLQENAHTDVIAPTNQEARQERGRHECVQNKIKFGQTPPVYPTCCNSSWSRIRQWQTGGSWNGGSSKWMVYKGNSNKMADLGVPPFPETSMHHIHMIHYDTHLLDMIATWSCCRPKIRMAWWGFWVPATSPGGGRWDTQHGSATCTFFATHSLAYLNCNDIRRSEDVSKLGVALN